MAADTQTGPRILYLEPFEGGSHAQFGAALRAAVPARWTCLTLPARHWKWRMRGAAPWWVRTEGAALAAGYDLIWASAYVPLAELYGLAPALQGVPAVLYFHENQLAYPVREARERDHHFGFTQLVSALAARVCAFNSAWNRDSFLAEADTLLARLPDKVPAGWTDAIRERSEVLPVLLELPDRAPEAGEWDAAGPIILWNHRWEYDKNPDAFFAALERLQAAALPFRVIVCGQRFSKAPAIFERARQRLGARVVHWGYAESRAEYEALLARADIAVSTADHEFFGIASLEAAHFGAWPLVPDRLAYPETFPAAHRYADGEALLGELERLIRGYLDRSLTLRGDRRALTAPFGEALAARYRSLVDRLLASKESSS